MTPYPAFDGSQNCGRKGVRPEWFFASQGNNGHALTAVKEICTGADGHPPCPFLQPCLDYALTYSVSGTWGGKSENERRRIRRAEGIVAQPVPTLPFLDSETRHGTAAAERAHYRAGQKLCDLCRIESRARSQKRRNSA